MKGKIIIVASVIMIFATISLFNNYKDSYYMAKDLEFICKYPRGEINKEKEEVRKYIISSFVKSGLEVKEQEFYYNDSEYKGVNIIATLPTKSTTKEKKILVIGAHYDTVNDVVSANDNAVGVAVLLNLARNLSNYDLDFEIHLIAFDFEELGCIGSNYYIISMGQDIDNVIGMINFDNFASKRAEKVNVYIGDQATNMLFNSLKKNKKYDDVVTSKFMGMSDFRYFLDRDIPILFFGHPVIEEERHNNNDVIENINKDALVYVYDAVINVVENIKILEI